MKEKKVYERQLGSKFDQKSEMSGKSRKVDPNNAYLYSESD